MKQTEECSSGRLSGLDLPNDKAEARCACRAGSFEVRVRRERDVHGISGESILRVLNPD